MGDHCRFRWHGRYTAVHPVMRVVLLAALVTGCGTANLSPAMPSSGQARPVLPVHLTAAQIAQLPRATTFGRSPRAPRDPDPDGPENGLVLHPTRTQVVYDSPGGSPVAALPVTQLGGPTWVPVVQSQPEWDRVLLPTRPNRSTGWIYLGAAGIRTASSAYRIEVSLATRRITVLDGGRSLGSWPAAVGTAATPTPTGRTFLLASVAPVHPTYSPLILPLGVHSDALGRFDGGAGTVALHGWPNPSVFGHAVSHGCVRVPAAALRALSQVPLGSPVIISDQSGETQ